VILYQLKWDVVKQTMTATVEDAQIVVISFGTMTKTPNVRFLQKL
jgi:hypothetical protein